MGSGERQWGLAGDWMWGRAGSLAGSVLRWLENPVVDDQLGGAILREMSKDSEILGYC